MAFLPPDPERKRYAIYSIVGIAVLSLLGHQLVYEPRSEELRDLEERIVRLERQNLAFRTAAAGAEEDGEPGRLASERNLLTIVEGLIPFAEELPQILDRIAVEAGDAGVELALIRPTSVSVEEYYERRLYDLAVLGSYHQIGDFLTRIGSLPRIVAPIDLALQPRDGAQQNGTGQRLEARFAIETYTVPGEGKREEGDDA